MLSMASRFQDSFKLCENVPAHVERRYYDCMGRKVLEMQQAGYIKTGTIKEVECCEGGHAGGRTDGCC